MEITIKLNEQEYEEYKKLKNYKPKELTDYTPNELASALYKVIKNDKNGEAICKTDMPNYDYGNPLKSSEGGALYAKFYDGNNQITLQVYTKNVYKEVKK